MFRANFSSDCMFATQPNSIHMRLEMFVCANNAFRQKDKIITSHHINDTNADFHCVRIFVFTTSTDAHHMRIIFQFIRHECIDIVVVNSNRGIFSQERFTTPSQVRTYIGHNLLPILWHRRADDPFAASNLLTVNRFVKAIKSHQRNSRFVSYSFLPQVEFAPCRLRWATTSDWFPGKFVWRTVYCCGNCVALSERARSQIRPIAGRSDFITPTIVVAGVRVKKTANSPRLHRWKRCASQFDWRFNHCGAFADHTARTHLDTIGLLSSRDYANHVSDRSDYDKHDTESVLECIDTVMGN